MKHVRDPRVTGSVRSRSHFGRASLVHSIANRQNQMRAVFVNWSSMTRRIWSFALSLASLACTSSDESVEPKPTEERPPNVAVAVEDPGAELHAPPSGPISEEPFGGSVWGFVETSTASGRIVVLRWFPSEPRFGHHGEPSVAPTLTAFDLVTGQQRELQELVEVAESRRHLLVLAEGALWLIDGETGSWESLTDVDLQHDSNACLWPRQGAFSLNGARVGWIGAKASALNVRDLATGEQWTVPAKGRLWRAWPDEQTRGAVLIEVPSGSTDWPLQGTSCACRWCNRFAMSYSTFGWSGPSFEIIAVGDDGSRREGQPPETEFALHGPTSSGCTLRASEQDGEALERGPWRWDCSKG
jgi:hypothetical protein